jgi:hypothetical protein
MTVIDTVVARSTANANFPYASVVTFVVCPLAAVNITVTPTKGQYGLGRALSEVVLLDAILNIPVKETVFPRTLSTTLGSNKTAPETVIVELSTKDIDDVLK